MKWAKSKFQDHESTYQSIWSATITGGKINIINAVAIVMVELLKRIIDLFFMVDCGKYQQLIYVIAATKAIRSLVNSIARK